MKRLLTTVLAFSVALILIHSSAVFGEVPTGKLELLTLQDIYHNGDKIFIEGKGFAENDELVAVALVVYNDDGSIDYKILKNHDLLIDFSGNLAGFAIIEGIDETDKFAQFAISTKYSSVVPTKKFAVQGDLSPFSNQMITGTGDFPSIEAGNFSFTEAGGDNIADLNERFDIVTPNIGWTPDVFLCFRREYSTGDGSGTPIASVSLPIADLEIVGVQLQGFVNNGSTAYNTLTQTMRLDVMDGTFLFGTSTNYFRTFADVIPPNLASAYATDLNTIRLVFDEEVNEIGALDASYKFDFGGTVTGVTASSISPVGSQPTDTWDLTISGLTNRDVGDLTIRYDSTNTSPSPPDTGVLEDAAGNEVKGNSFGSYITVQDSISPATPVLTAPIDSAYFEGGTVDWSATAESGSQDPSISFLELQGSNNGSNWVNTGSQDTDTGDENYSGSFTLGTQYAYYRVRAVDDQGNESFSGSTINYQNAHHISITSSPISEPVGTFEDQVTFQVRDAYGNAENVTQTFPLSMVAGTGTGSFRLTPTGGTITFVNLSGASSGSFYFAADQPGTKTIKIANVALFDAEQEADIVLGTASNILVVLPGQSFVDGTGVINAPTARDAGGSFNIQLVIVDGDNFVITTEDNPRDIDFSSTASDAPDGTRPTIDGVNSDSWANRSISFTDGVSGNILVVLYNAESSVTITADDDSGTPTLTGIESSALSINPGTLDDFNFVMTSPQRDNLPVTGTNILTALDLYQNVIIGFDASSDNVTITASGPGTTTITGLGSGNNNVLNQAGDFTNGVADLTAQGMIANVTAIGAYIFTATSASAVAGQTDNVYVNAVGSVSSPESGSSNNPNEYVIVDTRDPQCGDLPVRATFTGSTQSFDTLRVLWGFNNNDAIGTYSVSGQSGRLTPSGTPLRITSLIPAESLRLGFGNLFFHWWIENTSDDPRATILQGVPTSTDPQQLVVNPHLITSGGVNGGDVSQGSFTPGINDQEILSVLFQTNPGVAEIDITSLTFRKSGTADNLDISAFHLYNDVNGNGVFDSGTDILISTFSPYNNQSTIGFDISNFTAQGTINFVLLTVDISSSANILHALGMELNNNSAVIVDGTVLNTNSGLPRDAIFKDSFSPIGTAGDYSLPVTLVSFQAHAGYGNIQLEWTTASEENNDGFYIMRSEDPEGEFARLNDELIDGSGSVTTSHKYSFTDAEITPEVTYYYKLYSVDYNGEVYAYKTLASSAAMPLPKSFAVYQNYPNPFNPTTRLKFDVPKQAEITIEIYNMLGQKIRTLVSDEIYQPGVYDQVIWDARDDHGFQVANGIYYMIFNAKDFDFRQVRKLVFMK